jgi:DNA-binding transcriptional LysR family regulator
MVPSKNGYPTRKAAAVKVAPPPPAVSWEDVRLFLAVVDTGSFSKAARHLRIGQPTISRRMAALEEQLSEALFLRGVGGAALTAAGERLVPAARRMAESAGELARTIAGREARPEGVVRIAAPPGFAWEFLAPFARHVAKVEPGLRLQVLSSIEYLDLARGDADLAVRGRKPNQRDLTWRVGLEVRAAAFATKDYVARLPRGYGMADVGFISWAPPYTQLAPQPVMPKSALVELDLDLGPEAVGFIYLVLAKSALVVPRVRAVVELLEAEFRRVGNAKLLIAAQ